MAAPTSARALPAQLPNNSAPMVDGEGLLTIWGRYVFSLFAVKTTSVNPTFSIVVSNPPTQAEVQSIANQVAALCAAVGKSS